MKMQEIARACAFECERQEVYLNSVADLIRAYECALLLKDFYMPTESSIREIARIVNPSLAEKPGFRAKYRKVSVTFNSIRGGSNPQDIPLAMERLFQNLDAYQNEPEAFVKAFLDIHPFQDGNGRTAFILYNWLKGTLGENPLPLPDLYKS